MRPTRRFSIMFALSAAISACSPTAANFLEKEATALGTNSALDQRLHMALLDPPGVGLAFPGLLIGVEKSDQETIGGPAALPAGTVPLYPEAAGYERHRYGPHPAEKLFTDRKSLFVSHIMEYAPHADGLFPTRARGCLKYSAYGNSDVQTIARCPGSTPEGAPPRVGDAFMAGLKAIEELKPALRARLAESQTPYTHVLLYVMGWNTDQQEAVRNFNSLVGQLAEAHHRDCGKAGSCPALRPLVIGVSWPSLWNFPPPPFSYGNKASDADELGLVTLNVLLHRVIKPLKAEFAATRPLNTVLIGHSFGARALTRAAFSEPLLSPDGRPAPGRAVDLLLSLQGGFSVNRFLPEDSAENAPYADFKDTVGRIVMTASERDTANPVAWWSDHSGGRSGWERACGTPGRPAVFDCHRLEGDGVWPENASFAEGKVIYLDASNIVTYEVTGSGGGAHSDVYRLPMARLILKAINTFAPGEPAPVRTVSQASP